VYISSVVGWFGDWRKLLAGTEWDVEQQGTSSTEQVGTEQVGTEEVEGEKVDSEKVDIELEDRMMACVAREREQGDELESEEVVVSLVLSLFLAEEWFGRQH